MTWNVHQASPTAFNFGSMFRRQMIKHREKSMPNPSARAKRVMLHLPATYHLDDLRPYAVRIESIPEAYEFG